MGLFRRKSTEGLAPAAPQAPPSERRPDGQSPLDETLDTLAHLLRTFGRDAFRLDDEDTEPLAERCERWARHVLTGADAAPGGEEAPTRDAERDWPGLRRFFALRRVREAGYVERWLTESRELIGDLLAGMRSLTGAGQQAETSIATELNALEAAARGESLAELREAVGRTIGAIQTTLQEQRAQRDAELAAMGERLASMRQELLEARREMAIDPLTRIFNRRAFDEGLAQQVTLSSLSGQPLLLMMVDVDHFKAVNDTYGHTVGDEVLRELADRVVKVFPRRNDFVARYGGEELAVILPDVDPGGALRMAERVLEAVRGRTFDTNPPLAVTCSVGYALLRPGEEPDGLLRRADQALYRAKDEGRDRAVPAEEDDA